MTQALPTIVFADDNPEVCSEVCALLRSRYELVRVTMNGVDALRGILELAPDFAVLDISMPGKDGFTVAKHLRTIKSPTKVVFLTFSEDEDYIEVAKQCADGYVFKRRFSTDLFKALIMAGQGRFFCSGIS